MRPFEDQDNILSPSFRQESPAFKNSNNVGKGDVRFLSLREVASILRCTYETVRRVVKRGEMAYVQRPGCSIRVSETALNDYLERNTWPAQENPHALSASLTESSGTSQMDENAIAQRLRMRRQQNAS